MLSIKSSNRNSLLLTIAIAILYVLEYRYAYIHYVIAWYGYAGLTYKPLESTIVLLILAILPILFFKGVRNVASGISFFLYVFVYIPFIVTNQLADFPYYVRVLQSVSFMAIMILFFASDSLLFGDRFYVSFKRIFSFGQFELMVLVLFLFAIILNRRNLAFVNFFSQSSLLYELRESQSVSSVGRFNAYLTLWLSHGFIPILFVCYYIRKNWLRFSFTFLSFILLYMMDKQKITLLIPIVMWGVLYFIEHDYNKLKRYFHITLMLIIAIPSFFICKRVNETGNIKANTAALLLIVRTQCIEGEQLDRYTHFFEIAGNPYTFYSHIGVINAITNSYPYQKSIGESVGGEEGGNSNATFLLMDGLAAAGIPGCFFISLVFILIKSLLNAMGRRYNDKYLIAIFLSAIISILNSSLATSIISFGVLCIYISLLFFKFPMLIINNNNNLYD